MLIDDIYVIFMIQGYSWFVIGNFLFIPLYLFVFHSKLWHY